MGDVGVLLRNDANTSTTATLDPPRAPSFQVVPNGMGSITFEMDKADMPIAGLDDGSVLQATLGGTARYAYRIRRIRPTEVAVGEEARETTTLEGPSIMVDWDESLVQDPVGPDGDPLARTVPVLDNRVMGWMGCDFDEAASTSGTWVDANEIASQGYQFTHRWTAQPAGWQDPDAKWIGPHSGDDVDAPAGTNLLRRWVEVTAGRKILRYGGDNHVDVFINGEQKSRNADWKQSREFEFEVTVGGWLLLAFRLVNLAPTDPGNNPTAMLYSLLDIATNTVEVRSDSDTQSLEYPSTEPEIPVGTQIRAIMGGNGLLTPWTVSGTATHDANSEPFGATGVMSYRIAKDTCWDILRTLSEFVIDVGPAVSGLTLHPRVKGDLANASTLELVTGYSTAAKESADPHSIVNVGTDLKWDIPSPICTRLRVRYGRGRFLVGTGDRWGNLDLANIDDYDTAHAIASGIVELYAQSAATASFTLDWNETSEWPFTAFDQWSTLDVPGPYDHDTTTTQAIAAITCTGDDDQDGKAVFAVECGSLVESQATLLERSARRTTGGSALGGRAAGAVPALTLAGEDRRPVMSEWYVGDAQYIEDDDVGVFTGEMNPPMPAEVLSMRLRADPTDATGDTEAEVHINGVAVASFTLGASDSFDQVPVGLQTITSDAWKWVVTTHGGHTRLTIQASVAGAR